MKSQENKDEKVIYAVKESKKGGFSFFKLTLFVLLVAMSYYTWNHISTQEMGGEFVFKDHTKRYDNLNHIFPTKKYEQNKEEDKRSAYSNNTIYVIDFEGDVFASQVASLRNEIDAIKSVVKAGDKVLIRMNSPGGTVSGYGLVASQINRLQQDDVEIIVSVDEVAASGGYMASVVSDKIIVAPFAMVGSIGVVANIPIMEEMLKKIGIDYKTYTSGKSKRTVTQFQSPTKEQEDAFEKRLSSIHNQFIEHVKNNRESVDIEKAFTGEVFSGERAIELGLVDEIGTSDEFLMSHYNEGFSIFQIKYKESNNKSNGIVQTFVSSVVEAFKKEIIKESLSKGL